MVSHSKYPPESRNLGCQTSAFDQFWVLLRGLFNLCDLQLSRQKDELLWRASAASGASPHATSQGGFVHHRCNWDSKWPLKQRSLQPRMGHVSHQLIWKFRKGISTNHEWSANWENEHCELGNGSTAKNLSNLVLQTGFSLFAEAVPRSVSPQKDGIEFSWSNWGNRTFDHCDLQPFFHALLKSPGQRKYWRFSSSFMDYID